MPAQSIGDSGSGFPAAAYDSKVAAFSAKSVEEVASRERVAKSNRLFAGVTNHLGVLSSVVCEESVLLVRGTL